MRRDLAQTTFDLGVGVREQPPALIGQVVSDAASIAVVVISLHQASGDETVDHPRDARPAHRELLGQRRRGLLALAQQDQDAILRERQVDGGDRQLKLAGEPSDHPAWVLG
jgi:hypothetical protein